MKNFNYMIKKRLINSANKNEQNVPLIHFFLRMQNQNCYR